MRTHVGATTVAALIVGSVLVGCTPTSTVPLSTSATARATVPAPTSTPTVDVGGFTPVPTPPANGLDNQDTGGVAPTAAPPGAVIPSGDTITPALAGEAETTAGVFVSAFVRKDRTGTDWENGYMAYLTPYSQGAYADTGQANVPGSRVTGAPALAEDGINTTTSATITVPTDAGSYQVQLLAANAGAWLVQRALLPGTNQ